VPQLIRSYGEFAARYTSADLLELGPGIKTGIPIRYDDPREVGPDRIANSVAAAERYRRTVHRRRLRHVDELRRRLG
jgi:type III pantothenate kinase